MIRILRDTIGEIIGAFDIADISNIIHAEIDGKWYTIINHKNPGNPCVKYGYSTSFIVKQLFPDETKV